MSVESEQRAVFELLRMAQCDTVAEAVKNWEAERQGMRELHDINSAWQIYHRRFVLVVGFMLKYLDAVDQDGAMFLPLKARDLSVTMRKQIAKMDVALRKVRELLDV